MMDRMIRAMTLLDLLTETRQSDMLTDPNCQGGDSVDTEYVRELQADGARELALAVYQDNAGDPAAAIEALIWMPV